MMLMSHLALTETVPECKNLFEEGCEGFENIIDTTMDAQSPFEEINFRTTKIYFFVFYKALV